MTRPFHARVFHPARGLAGPTRQTILGKALRARREAKASPFPVRRDRWETSDGDFVDLDFVSSSAVPGWQPGDPVCLVLHGLEGSSRRPYVRITLRELARTGIRGVALNFRSCSGEPNRLARSYHSGETEDLAWVLNRLFRDESPAALGVIGYSLGGNILLKYLGETGLSARADVACAVSVPYDLSAGADAISRGLIGTVYTSYFLRSLKTKVVAKRDLMTAYDVEAGLRARTIRAFDDAITAPVHGFRDAEDYYRRCSAAAFLDRVAVPTLLLHSRDDPFQTVDTLPIRGMTGHPSLITVLTDRGGHLGFVGTETGRHRFCWAEEEAVRWMAGRLRAAQSVDG